MGYNMAVGARSKKQFKSGWVFCASYTEALAYIDKNGKPEKIAVTKTRKGSDADYKKLMNVKKKKTSTDNIDVEKAR